MPHIPAYAPLAAVAVVCFAAGWWANRRRYEQLHGQAEPGAG